MEKRWYSVALSTVIVGCGGDTDNGNTGTPGGGTSVDAGVPTLTGGQPAAFYGMLVTTGGTTSVDTGTPGTMGGGIVAYYGVLPPVGGGQNSGTAVQTGGSASINTGMPTSTGGMVPIPVYGAISVAPSAANRG